MEFKKFMEALKGNQHKLDKNKNGKLDSDDFQKLRKEETIEEESDAYAKSEENKRSADAAKKQGDMFAHHLHMADHHDNLAQWHGEKGRHSTADSHAEKSEQHHDMAMKLKMKKEEVEHIDEAGYPEVDHMPGRHVSRADTHKTSKYTVATNAMGGHKEHRVKVDASSENHARNLGAEHFEKKGLKARVHFDGVRVVKEEVEHIDELKKSTLASYAKKAANSMDTHAYHAYRHQDDGDYDKKEKRKQGISKAVDRLAKEEVELDEATPYYQKASWIKKMSAAAKKERLAREKKEKESKPQVKEESDLLEYEIDHDGKGNYRDDEGNEWNSKSKNSPRGSFARKHTITSDAPHSVHINGKKWKTFGSQSHATNVANKIKGATVHKEEVELEEASVETRSDYNVDKAGRKSHKQITFKDGSTTGNEKEDEMKEEKMSDADMKERERIVKGMKKNISGFKAKYGERAKEVMYATATKMAKEEVELDEKFINGREYASHGLMHPDHASMNLHKVTGHNVDFYAHGTGDKVEGKVTKNDGKAVHIKDTKGTTHKFKVTPHLPKKVEEQAPVAPVPGDKWKSHAVMVNGKQRVVIPRKNAHNYPEHEGWKEVAPGTKVKKEDVDFDEQGNLMAEKLKFADFIAKMNEQLLEYESDSSGVYRHTKKATYGTSYQGDDDEDEKPKKAAAPDAPKRGRGRPAGSTGASYKPRSAATAAAAKAKAAATKAANKK
jgi:hypothetical protein